MKGRATQTSGLVSQISFSFFFFFLGRGWREVVIQQLLRCMVVSPKEFVSSCYVFLFLFFVFSEGMVSRTTSELVYYPMFERLRSHICPSSCSLNSLSAQSEYQQWESSGRPLEASPRIKMAHFLPPQFELRLVKSLVVRFGAVRVIYSWGWWIVSQVTG